jgi:cyclopropane fatty-acyl-phospholipid synthase-like methyltransferase
MDLEQGVIRHYTRGDLNDIVLSWLSAAGRDPRRPAPDDLAPIDELHSGGREATVAFAEGIALKRDHRLLDIGCGIGGPARFFADRTGCRVEGIDLTPEHIDVAIDLTRRMQLNDLVTFRVANALDLSWVSQPFDAAIMLHVGMNIQDKERLFRNVRAALKAGSTFGIYDLMRTSPDTIAFPMLWAQTSATSFVEEPETYCRLLEGAGFAIVREHNYRELVLDYNRRWRAECAKNDALPSMLTAMRGADWSKRAANLNEAMKARCLSPIELICRAV